MKRKITELLLRVLDNHPSAKRDLVIRFVGEDKLRYYGFKAKPPPLRYSKILRIYNMLASGLNEKTYLSAVKGIEDALKQGIEELDQKATTEALTTVFALIFELKCRAGVANFDTIIEILALTIIREDEDPHKFNGKIHHEKRLLIKTMLLKTPDRIMFLPEYRKFYDAGVGGDLIEDLANNSDLSTNQINAILATNS